jgi:5-(carboxyamino)imidazole ribonucleotide mutase
MAKVGIIMGSKSDLPVMQEAVDALNKFEISIEVDIVW